MPPDPTSSSSSYRPSTTSPTTGEGPSRTCRYLRAGSGLEGLFPDRERLVELGVGEHERAEDADAVGVDPGLQEQEPALGRSLDDLRREICRRRLRLPVGDELEREHRAEAADVADRGEALLPAEH